MEPVYDELVCSVNFYDPAKSITLITLCLYWSCSSSSSKDSKWPNPCNDVDSIIHFD